MSESDEESVETVRDTVSEKGEIMKPNWWFKTTEKGRSIREEPQKIEYLKIGTGETYIHVFGTAFWRDGCMDIASMHRCGITHWRNLDLEQAEGRREGPKR